VTFISDKTRKVSKRQRCWN